MKTAPTCTREISTGALLLSARDAAATCGVSKATWWRLDSAGKIPQPIKIGGSTRWRTDDLRRWVAAGCPDRETWLRISGEGPA